MSETNAELRRIRAYMVKTIQLQQAVNAATLIAIDQHDQCRTDALIGLLDTTTGTIGWINRYARLADRVSSTENKRKETNRLGALISQTAILYDTAKNAASAAGISSDAIESSPN
jgi:hypothetical protein